MLFVQYLQNNGVRVVLEAIAKPDRELKDKYLSLHAGLARTVCDQPHTYDIRCCICPEGFQDNAVSGLVCKGSRVRRRRTQRTSSRKWSSSDQTPRDFYMLDNELGARVYLVCL